ncbi:MAG: hypothetical protein JXQ73_26390 [Phycisphaerae bacterium]|nr:hypothetical protein [Phycisphaerae bacterium]
MTPRRRNDQARRVCPSRRALMRWTDRGGSLPAQLSEHVTSCPRCAKWVSRIARVQAALTLLTTDAAPQGILARANQKALRMLARSLREDEQALRLSQAQPNAGLWPLLEGPLHRTVAGAAAAVILLSLQTSVASGMERTRDLAQPLADAHFQRHIDDQGMLT